MHTEPNLTTVHNRKISQRFLHNQKISTSKLQVSRIYFYFSERDHSSCNNIDVNLQKIITGIGIETLACNTLILPLTQVNDVTLSRIMFTSTSDVMKI